MKSEEFPNKSLEVFLKNVLKKYLKKLWFSEKKVGNFSKIIHRGISENRHDGISEEIGKFSKGIPCNIFQSNELEAAFKTILKANQKA